MTNNEDVQQHQDQQHEQVLDTSPPQEERYAGFWMRFWAYITDLIIVFSINGILLSTISFVNDGAPITVGYWTLNAILGSLVFFAYFVLMTKKLGQTLGKMIFGLKVIRSDHKPLQWRDLLFREVVMRFIYRAFFILNILYLVVAFNNEKQGLHDIVGNTRVIHVG